MIRALLWKEYREQRAAWLMIACLYYVLLICLSAFETFGRVPELVQGLGVVMAWTYGLVCGAMLLANERETGGMPFLNMLPAWRLHLWLTKALIGLLLLLAQVAVLAAGIFAWLGAGAKGWQGTGTVLGMLFSGLLGLSWGLLLSARAPSVVSAIVLGMVAQCIGGFFAALLANWLVYPLGLLGAHLGLGDQALPVVFGSLLTLALIAGPFVGSAWLFTDVDRQRGPRVRRRHLTPEPAVRPSRLASWGRMVWLSWRQSRGVLLGLAGFALLLGVVVPLAGPLAWPALSLLLGVLCGVSTWGDEQLHASFRFLGDQRLPLGRVWLVKVGSRFVLLVFVALVLLLPSTVVAVYQRNTARGQHGPFLGEVLRSSLVGEVVPALLHLTMWPLYGLAAGVLCGLLFRKSLVAGVVALSSSAILASLWLPSLVGIGLHFWQVVGVPVAMLAASWLLIPAWAADRLVARPTFVRLGGLLSLGALWTAGGLWYRVAEIPDVPDRLDIAAFRASIPPPDKGKNDAGLAIRDAWGQVERMSRELSEKHSEKPLFPDLQPQPFANPQGTVSFADEIDAVLQRGWPAGRSEVGDWLDEQFRGEWYAGLAKLPDYPLGVVEDPRKLNFTSRVGKWQAGVALSRLLAARSLQRQAAGDPVAFVTNLRIALALARNFQHRAPPLVARFGASAESVWTSDALDRWLGRLPGRADVLEEVRDLLVRHEAELPDPEDATRAAAVVAQNSLEEVPDQLLGMVANPSASDPTTRRAEIEVAAILWRFPWEQERHRRVVRVLTQGDAGQQHRAYEQGGGALAFVCRRPYTRGKREAAQLHAAQLKVALRLYQAQHGRLPAALNELVPRYLPAVPADPFDGAPFRYRVSQGENVGWIDANRFPPAGMLPQPQLFVPAGQGILWSVGDDNTDNGGIWDGSRRSVAELGEDLIFLVPPPPG